MAMVTICIETDNAAFGSEPGPELARILRELAAKFRDGGGVPAKIMDVNGNTVGRVEFSR